jgi:hypothetical protein
MLLDYTSSDVGPYRELLYIPGILARGMRPVWTISRILVSTLASVENGRRNWGIPKELAAFDWLKEGAGERVRVSTGGHVFLDAHLRHGRLGFPASAGFLPPFLRTLCQLQGGRFLFTAPSGRGRVTRARVEELHIDSSRFPDFGLRSPLLAIHLGGLEMRFPVPTVESAGA